MYYKNILLMYKIFTRSKTLLENEKYAIDHSPRFHVVLIFNYKVFLLCSVITLSVYLLLVKIDGSPSNFFHLFHKSYTCHLAKHFVSNITFCYGLFIYEMQLISDIFFMPSLSLYILRYRVKQKISFVFYKY